MNSKENLMTLPYGNSKRLNVFACVRALKEDYPIHSHNFFEIEILMNGSGTQIVNGQKFPWVPGGICFLSPADRHEIIVEEAMKVVNISFDYEYVDKDTIKDIVMLGENLFYSVGIDREHFEKIAVMLVQANDSPLSGNDKYMLLLLNAFLMKLKSISSNIPNLNNQIPTIKQALLYMHANFNSKITLGDIANAVHLSPAYFSELFRQKMKITVSQYLLELRIDYAKKLLDSTNDSITDICFASGFTSLSNFMKIFKKITNTSPLKYRKRGISNETTN